MKRIIILGLCSIFMMFICLPAYAADTDIKVLVNGKMVESDAPALNVQGSVMLPFRAILNAIGVTDNEIEWRAKSQSMEIRHNNRYVFLAIGNRGAVVDTGMTMLGVAPFINEGRTMIPIRFIAEAFGADVQWDGDTSTVKIKTKK